MEGASYYDDELREVMGEEWNPDWDVIDNVKSIVRELTHLRQLAKINQFYVKKLANWLEEE